MKMHKNKIIVLGSINMDLVVSANKAPDAGETLFGKTFQTIPGGKGANQAVAIARQGGNVSMIARVGEDGFGDELVEKLSENNVDIRKVYKEKSSSTGVALIVVEGDGQNRIVVVPGANGKVSQSDVDDSADLFDNCDFLVMQLETPLSTIEYATNVAKSKGVRTVLNSAPGMPLKEEFLKQIDYLILNESECEMLTGREVRGKASSFNAIKILQAKTGNSVILTLGSEGVVSIEDNNVWHTKAFKVDVVDTTAAGDAFVGGLVISLQSGKSLKDAVEYASASGALATTKFGAQPSLPSEIDVKNFLSKAHLENR